MTPAAFIRISAVVSDAWPVRNGYARYLGAPGQAYR